MKLKKSDINIILMFVGVVLAFVSYFVVYKKLTSNTEDLKAQNAVLQEEVNYLQQLADNKQQYLDDTAKMQKEIDNIKSQFPSEYRAEDEILYVVDLQDKYDMSSEFINMGTAAVIEVPVAAETAPAEAAPAEAAPAEGETVVDSGTATDPVEPAVPEIMLYRTPVTVSMITGYEDVKDIIKTINTDEYRKSIDTLTLEFDTETGELRGNMAFSMYALSGTEAVYTTPEVPGIQYGTQNIFNSAEKKAAIEAEAEAQDEADAAKEDEEE